MNTLQCVIVCVDIQLQTSLCWPDKSTQKTGPEIEKLEYQSRYAHNFFCLQSTMLCTYSWLQKINIRLLCYSYGYSFFFTTKYFCHLLVQWWVASELKITILVALLIMYLISSQAVKKSVALCKKASVKNLWNSVSDRLTTIAGTWGPNSTWEGPMTTQFSPLSRAFTQE